MASGEEEEEEPLLHDDYNHLFQTEAERELTLRQSDPKGTSPAQDQPESHHLPSQSRSRRRSDVLEATELSRIRRNYSRATGSYGRAQAPPAQASPTGLWRWKYAIYRFWKHQISIVVPYETCRDHLALERTFLAYLRTSLALSMSGITVAQLFRLQHSPNPNPIFGYYVLGKPLACICQGTAIYSILLGAYRSWRHQNAIARGKAIAGGFEVSLMGIGVLVICVMFFVLLIAVDINKED